jgi:RNA polymerase primary sigma factor
MKDYYEPPERSFQVLEDPESFIQDEMLSMSSWEILEIEIETDKGKKTKIRPGAKGKNKRIYSENRDSNFFNNLTILSEDEQAERFKDIADGKREIALIYLKLLFLNDQEPGRLRESEHINAILDAFYCKYVDSRSHGWSHGWSHGYPEKINERDSREQADPIDDQPDLFPEQAKTIEAADELLNVFMSSWAALSSRVHENGISSWSQSFGKEFDLSVDQFGKALGKLDLSIKDMDSVMIASINNVRVKNYVTEKTAKNAIFEISRAKLRWAKARESIVESNLPLVMYFAKKYEYCGLSKSDLTNDGSIGLMKAVDRFDPSMGAKLSTYAAWWIRQSLDSSSKGPKKQLHIPDYVFSDISKIWAAREKLIQTSGKEFDSESEGFDAGKPEPSVEQLAKATNLRPERVKNALEAQAYVLSLDSETGEDGGRTLYELVDDREGASPEENAINMATSGKILEILRKTLSDLEFKVIVRRYGVGHFSEATQDEIARELFCSKQNVSQAERRAITKLKKSKDVSLMFELVTGRKRS